MKTADELIQAELDSLAETADRVESMREDVISLVEIAELIIPEHLAPDVALGVRPGGLQGVLLHLHNVSDLSKEVVPVLRALRNRGWKIESHDDYAVIQRRSYHLKKGDHRIVVSSFLQGSMLSKGKGEGPSCEFIKTGTVEVAEYKLVCPDGVDIDLELSKEEP